jgi:transcriptional regulator with XRE-family HTH domain
MARKYSSPLLQKVLDRITPLQSMEVSTKMQIAARIDDMIRERGWSKSEFAEKVNKNPSEISRWLSGIHNFTIDTLCEIAVVLGVQFSDLFAENKIQVFETKIVSNVPDSDFKYPVFEKSSAVEEPQMEYTASILNKEDKRIHNSESPGGVFVPQNTIIKSIEILESSFRLPKEYNQPAAIIHFDLKFETSQTSIGDEIRSIVTVRTHIEKFLLEVGTLKAAFIFRTLDLENLIKANDDSKRNIPDELLKSIHSMALSTMRGILYSHWRGTFLHHAILPEVDINTFKGS